MNPTNTTLAENETSCCCSTSCKIAADAAPEPEVVQVPEPADSCCAGDHCSAS